MHLLPHLCRMAPDAPAPSPLSHGRALLWRAECAASLNRTLWERLRSASPTAPRHHRRSGDHSGLLRAQPGATGTSPPGCQRGWVSLGTHLNFTSCPPIASWNLFLPLTCDAGFSKTLHNPRTHTGVPPLSCLSATVIRKCPLLSPSFTSQPLGAGFRHLCICSYISPPHPHLGRIC